MLCKVKVQEEIIQPNGHVVYMDRHDMGSQLGECDVPSTAMKRAKAMFKDRYGTAFTVLSCGLLSRTVVKLMVREGPRPGSVVQPGTVRRPPGVRKGKRIARTRPAKS